MELRELPSIHSLLRNRQLVGLPHEVSVAAAREVLELARARIAAGIEPGDLPTAVVEAARARLSPRLRAAINATGVVLHTNLGRAPLAAGAIERVCEVAAGYSNLEYDLAEGTRGSRHRHLAAILRDLTGAEDALVVNNNAAALLLVVTALARDREVIVSRGELIEIGDGFRIPDVLSVSGARLREVGTTNRTRVADYESAIGDDTALLLRVHQSNFRTVGFSDRPPLKGLAGVAARHSLPLVDDLGSGSLVPLGDDPLVTDSIQAGVDLVTFSGDKLLGGPQAGIVAGRAKVVAMLRHHPLLRALRPDKLTLAALEGTLLLYLDPKRAVAEVPALRALLEPDGNVRRRAERLAAAVSGEVVESVGRAGGGTLPLFELPSFACAVEAELEPLLRLGDPPVVAVIRDGKTLLDCRTVSDGEIDRLTGAVRAARAS